MKLLSKPIRRLTTLIGIFFIAGCGVWALRSEGVSWGWIGLLLVTMPFGLLLYRITYISRFLEGMRKILSKQK